MSYCTSSHGDDWSALGLLFKVFSFVSQEYTMAQPWHPSSYVRRLIGHWWQSCKHVIRHILIASKQVFLSCIRQTTFRCSLPDYLTRFIFTLNYGKNNHYTLFSTLICRGPATAGFRHSHEGPALKWKCRNPSPIPRAAEIQVWRDNTQLIRYYCTPSLSV